MPAIHSMMKRLGFVKLRDYGLVLTPEGRILSIRPAVLDDGLGGRIVGWKDDDLAAMELDRWSELGRAMAQKPAAAPAVAKAVAVRPIAPITAARTVAPPIPALAPPIPAAPARPAAPPIAPKPVVVAPSVAPEPVVEEDDWEWTIAIARARAAAEEAEQAAAKAQVPPPIPTGRPRQLTPARPVPAAALAMAKSAAETAAKVVNQFDVSDHTSPTLRVVTKDMPTLASKSAFVQQDTIIDPPTPTLAKTTPIARLAEPIEKTTPIAKIAAPIAKLAEPKAAVPPPLGIPTPPQPLPVVRPRTETVQAPNRSFSRGLSPVTVIPIPKMPKVEPSRIAPVVARRTGQAPVVPLRLAKGTGPVTPSTANSNVGDQTTPNLSVGDKTLPSLLLPSVSR